MKLSEKIKTARESKELTQTELAYKLNVTLNDIENWENGSVKPSTEQIVRLSEVLEVALHYLLKEDPETIEETSPTNSQQETPNVIYGATGEEYGINQKRLQTCKIWLIIGAICTPIFGGSQFYNYNAQYAVIIMVVMCLISIPLCFLTISMISKAKTKSQLTLWGLIACIFVSLIGGVLILTADFKEEPNN